MKKYGYAWFVVICLFGANACAQSMSMKPDWSNTTEYRVGLSGTILTFVLPGAVSREFELTLPADKNIHDQSLYRDWDSFLLANMFWDYKSRKLLWQNVYGSLNLRMTVHRISAGDGLSDTQALAQAIEASMRAAYGISPGERQSDSGLRLPEDFKDVDINNRAWLAFSVRRGNEEPGMLNYAIRLTDTHYLKVSLKVMENYDRAEKNWYEQATGDIRKIVDSLKVNGPG